MEDKEIETIRDNISFILSDNNYKHKHTFGDIDVFRNEKTGKKYIVEVTELVE